jgi:ribosomal protein S18 acetylase RimI-like enzyme
MTAASDYVLVASPPSLDEYLRLRSESGLSPKRPEQGVAALANSWSFCHIRSLVDDSAVAMGRIVGDGGWYFHIADMATLPAHQRNGLGRRVIEWLVEDIRTRAPEDPYITLIADAPGRRLYESVGFRDVGPYGVGMQLVLPS